MSKLSLISVLCLAGATTSASALAQTSPPAPSAAATPAVTAVPQETLFQRAGGAPKLGWFISPTSGFSSMDGHVARTVGIRTALVLNQTWGFGLAGNIIGMERTEFDDDNTRDIGGYGGLYFQYTLRSNNLVHAFADLTAGGGAWCGQLIDDDCKDRNDFAFIEPTINVELNVFKYMRVSAGVGYRAATADKDALLSSQKLSGVVGRTSLVFGMF